MKNPLFKLSLIALTAALAYSATSACTEITIKAKNNAVVVGRSMEFGPNLQSDVMSSPRGRAFKTVGPNKKPGVSWHSKYGYLILDYFKSGHPVDGMNEKGLSFGYLYLPGNTQYPKVAPGQSSKALAYNELGDWVLGNFKTVAEVKKALKNVVVFAQPQSFPGHPNAVFPLHAIITDAKGNSMVVEFNKGKMQIYDDKIGVLTNSPTFDWQMTNLKNYANLTPFAPATIKVSGYEYSGTGQGAGAVGLPGDTTPPSRFVKMAFLTQYAASAKNAAGARNLAEHILNNVDIAKGTVRGEKGQPDPSPETTQWTVFKDLKNHVLYFKSYTNPTLQAIDLNKVNFAPGAKQLNIPVAAPAMITDATARFNQS